MLAFDERGPAEAPTVVLVHGFADSAAMWFLRKPDLFARFHVIAADLPGHGRSPPYHTSRLTIKDLAMELQLLLRKVKTDDFTLVGHSMGGMVAQQYSIDHPEHVKNLVLCSTASGGSNLPAIQELKETINQNGLRAALSVDQYASTSFGDNVDESLVQTYLELEYKTDQETSVRCLDAMANWSLDLESVRNFRGTTVLLFGDQDKITPMKVCAASLRAAYNHTVIEIVKGAGHMVYLEKPNEFERLVTKYITR